MLIVPLQAVPNQTVQCTLNGQQCTLNVYQKFFGIFMDVLVNSALVIGGVQCENGQRIVQSLYLGFQGDFIWIDTQGTSDPYYTGIGNRYFLVYLSPSDLPTGVG